jgi:chemotaxis protein MotB
MSDTDEQGGGIPEWVVTFGDMMSLLLTFFIMLVSLSEIREEEKYQAMVESIRKQFGHDAASVSLIPGSARPRNSKISKLAAQGRAEIFDTHRGGDKIDAPVGDHPRVLIVRPGSQATVGTVVLFDENSATLSDKAKAILGEQLQNLIGKTHRIEVRGHTSARPLTPNSGWEDHWELAYRRSRAVLHYLCDAGIDPQRIRLSVAGPNEPRDLGERTSDLQGNSRVEVFMLDEVKEDLQGTPRERGRRFAVPQDTATTADAPA